MKITLRQLQVFIMIAKIGNMSQAAQRLHLSQSACSMALTALEQQLSGELFDRNNNRLLLNDRGRILLPRAISLIDQVAELQDLLEPNTASVLTGSLTVGASTTIGNYLLPIAIAQFMTIHPETKINLMIRNSQQIVEQLLNFEIDLGFIEGNCSHQALEVEPWQKDELIIIAAPNHPLVRKKKISMPDLMDQKWIVRESGSGTREKFTEAMGGPIVPFLELGHTEAIKNAVETGIGISCVSKATVINSLKHGSLVAINTPFLKLTRDFYRIIHKQKYKTRLLYQFIDFNLVIKKRSPVAVKVVQNQR